MNCLYTSRSLTCHVPSICSLLCEYIQKITEGTVNVRISKRTLYFHSRLQRSVERVVPPPTESVAAINYNQLLKDLFPEGISGARQEAADAGQIAGGVPGEDIAPKDPSRC